MKRRAQHRLLVVEDEPLVAEDACALLVAAGYDVLPPVTSARDVDAAMRGRTPDLVLLDIELDRGHDGIELGLHVVEEYGVPVVFVSAHSDTKTLARTAAVAPQGFVVKPFRAEQLLATVGSALSRLRGVEGPDAVPTVSRVPGEELLTERERDVLEGLLAGRRVRGIAASRGVSVHTVRNQVKSIFFKLDVHSQEALVLRFASRARGTGARR